jgi:hypothetical protein
VVLDEIHEMYKIHNMNKPSDNPSTADNQQEISLDPSNQASMAFCTELLDLHESTNDPIKRRQLEELLGEYLHNFPYVAPEFRGIKCQPYRQRMLEIMRESSPETTRDASE